MGSGPVVLSLRNGSIIYFSECVVRYILSCIEHRLWKGARALEVRGDVDDEFNAAVDAENRRIAGGASDVNSWYKNELGRVSQNWPFTLLEYWQRPLRVEPRGLRVSRCRGRAAHVRLSAGASSRPVGFRARSTRAVGGV